MPQELFFFNTVAMDAGYGAGPSKAVTLQVSLPHRTAEALTVHVASSGGKSQLAVRFADVPGVELFELSVKPPPARSSDGHGGGGMGMDGLEWLNYFPKVGVFGIALVGVVIWNVRKTRKSSGKAASNDDFDDAYLKEILAETRKKRLDKENNAPATATTQATEPSRPSGPSSSSGEAIPFEGIDREEDDDD